jgi:CRP-like cAMP-binding protein
VERHYRKVEITPDSLLGSRFFDRLERAERAHAVRYCEGRCYEAGAEIIRHGDSTRDVFFILSGRVNASLMTAAGKELTFQELVGGDMFGELSAIDGAPRSASVVTLDETVLIRLSGPSFRELMARHPSLAEQTMLRLCGLARFLCESAFEARAFHVPEQIRLELARIVSSHRTGDGPVVIDPAPTHAEIARRVGTSREQVTRVMRDFARRGLIEQSRKAWTVTDPEAVCSEAVSD